METKFSQFLRFGGSGGVALVQDANGVVARPLSRKSDILGFASLQQQFTTTLDSVDQTVADLILRATRLSFDLPIFASDLADISTEKNAITKEWAERLHSIWKEYGERPTHFATVRRVMEGNLIPAFFADVNERRQRALGIDHYIWRTRDDKDVRHEHALNDDKIFGWDNPPETGHPGQSYGCRCYAEPYLFNIDICAPDLLAAQLAHQKGVTNGVWEAVKDTLTDIWQTLKEIPENLEWVTRLGVLSAKEKFGTLLDSERTELENMRKAIDARVAEIQKFLADFPETAKAFAKFAYAIQTRPGMVMDEYAECRATLKQIEEAAREQAYLNTLIGLNVAPGLLISKVLRRLGPGGDSNDPDRLRDKLLDGADDAGRLPSDTDWDVIENPGIRWGGPIKEQGDAWEDHLEGLGGLGIRTPGNFRTFDFWDQDEGLATSAKTLDTRALGYVERPARIFNKLKQYIDQIDGFEYDRKNGLEIDEGMIKSKGLVLAIPDTSTPEQLTQIQRAIDYAESLGIDVKVRRIQ